MLILNVIVATVYISNLYLLTFVDVRGKMSRNV